MATRKTKKAVLFVVEGPSDETALGLPFQSVFASDAVKFDVVHGDLTAQISRKPPRERLRDTVLAHLERSAGYRWDDIKMIVEVCDTDGAFIPEDRVIPSQEKQLAYGADCITVGDVAGIRKRNGVKASAMRQLSSIGHLTYKKHEVPLYACYLSRNLEHALHNEAGECSNARKEELAHQFQRRYGRDVEGFKSFLRSAALAAPGDFKESWEWIQKKHQLIEKGFQFASSSPRVRGARKLERSTAATRESRAICTRFAHKGRSAKPLGTKKVTGFAP